MSDQKLTLEMSLFEFLTSSKEALAKYNMQSLDCYHGIGVGYRGKVNITRSGRSCQRWISQCPHRHLRIPEDVVDGQNDSNMCRNPDASAPGGPWCYTTDPKVRWEYCNISRCPPRGTFCCCKILQLKKEQLNMHAAKEAYLISYTKRYTLPID